MIKVFISQPMNGFTDEEIKNARVRIANKVAEAMNDEVTIIDSFFEGAPHDAKPLWFLGKSFELLSTADVVFFGNEWDKYRGCKMEHEAALRYGYKIMYEEG